MEQELRNGLMVGHAYSVTDIRKIRYGSNNVHLIRIRNPWGDEHEWKGAWSDQSREWRSVPDNEKQAMGITFDHDGEFWMSFDDFVSNFHRLDVCLLGPDSQCGGGEMSRIVAKWESKLFDGSWRRRVNAGGCRNHPQTFWTNPQYKVSISRPDSDTSDGNGSIIVGLMQKDRRKMRSEGKTELTIGYAVYKAPAGHTGTLDRRFFETHSTSAKSSAYCNLREISDRHRLPPGEYIVVPSTFEPNEEGDFILRVFSERNSDKVSELDDETDYKPSVADDRFKKSDDKPNEDAAYKAFLNLAGSDREIDAFELQHILNILYSKEFKVGGFSVDLTRSMVAMCDTDLTGKLNYDEYKRLYRDLLLCKHTFYAMDKDGNGYFSSYEFRDALRLLGMHVSNSTFNAIVMRYSDQRGEVQFQDFVAAYIKLKLLFALFDNKDRSHSGRAKFNIEEVVKYTSFLL
jgi:calpain